MKTRNKALLLVLCAVILAAASVFGTMAYLTDTEAVENTFTVGKVKLGDADVNEKGLDEALVNEYGLPINNETDKTVVNVGDAPRVQGNDYKLIPGHLYTKDPTVHVKNDSENSYIFVKVGNGIAGIEATETDIYKKIDTQILNNGWEKLTGYDGVYWKRWEKSSTTTGTTDLKVFSEFKIDGEKVTAAVLENYKNAEITVNAYAIQEDGFTTPADAWVAGKFGNIVTGN